MYPSEPPPNQLFPVNSGQERQTTVQNTEHSLSQPFQWPLDSPYSQPGDVYQPFVNHQYFNQQPDVNQQYVNQTGYPWNGSEDIQQPVNQKYANQVDDSWNGREDIQQPVDQQFANQADHTWNGPKDIQHPVDRQYANQADHTWNGPKDIQHPVDRQYANQADHTWNGPEDIQHPVDRQYANQADHTWNGPKDIQHPVDRQYANQADHTWNGPEDIQHPVDRQYANQADHTWNGPEGIQPLVNHQDHNQMQYPWYGPQEGTSEQPAGHMGNQFDFNANQYNGSPYGNFTTYQDAQPIFGSNMHQGTAIPFDSTSRIQQNSSKAPRKQRKHFSLEVNSILQRHYYQNPNPNLALRKMIASETKLTYDQVYFWFRNVRKKEGKMLRGERPHAPLFNENSRSFSEEHTNILLASYKKNKYPEAEEMDIIAHQLNCEFHKVVIWFRNQRHRDKQQEPVHSIQH